MSRPKKPKRRVRPPKLCLWDRVIYLVLLVLCVAVFFLPFLVFLLVQNRFVMASGEVLAYNAHGWMLFVLIPEMAFIAPSVWLACRWQDRKPFVGPKLPQDGPIVRKKKKKPYERNMKKLAAALAGLYLLLCVPAVGAFFARSEITATEVRAYTLFGVETHRAPLSDVVRVKADIYYSSGGRSSGGWEASYTVTLRDGKKYIFSPNPMTLVDIDKHIPPCPRTVEGIEHFDDLCREYDLTSDEATRLRAILRTSP